MSNKKRVGLFCGSKSGNNPNYIAAADQFGRWLANQEMSLVYGGGSVGLMGVAARAVLEGGGHVHGIITKGLLDLEVGLNTIQKLDVVPSMSERKTRLIAESDLFVILPGGYGTWDEVFEVVTLRQLGFHSKPLLLYNIDGYFDAMKQVLDRTITDGFVSSEHGEYIAYANTFEDLTRWILNFSQKV